MRLVRPGPEYLPSYLDALDRGWVADNSRPAGAGEVDRIKDDPAAFLSGLDDRTAKGPPITLPDGSLTQRLPGFHTWMWDGEFCGSISLRWQTGTAELPPYCLGHIGYSVVAWKRNNGYATAALRMLLPEAQAIGLPYVELTTDLGNIASQHVILANNGVQIEQFKKPAVYGAGPALRFRIMFEQTPPPSETT